MKRRAALQLLGLATLATLTPERNTVTQPVSHGFPDWGRQRAASDINVLNIDNLNLAAPVVQGPVFVGNMPFLYVRQASAQAMRTGILWYQDAAATINIGGDALHSRAGEDCVTSVPVRGPYVTFSMGLLAYPGLTDLQVSMTPGTFNNNNLLFDANVLISSDGAVVGAGAGLTLASTTARGGWIYWGASLFDASSWYARLYAVDFTGTTILLDSFNSPDAKRGGLLFAPSMPLNMVVFNRDAVARSTSATVVFHPYLS